MSVRSAALAAAILLGSFGSSGAQQPTVSDIALCNEEATAKTGGSALPGRRPEPEIGGKNPELGTQERSAPRSGSGLGGQTREMTDPSGSIITGSPDPLVTGMDAEKANDPAYRTAYRDCMRHRMRKDR